MIPTVLLVAAGALILVSLMLVTAARLTGFQPLGARQDPAIAQSVDIVLSSSREGGAKVTRPDGSLIADMTDREAGFIAVAERALAFERRRNRADPTAPVTLIRWADGRMSLRDTITNWRIEISYFGVDSQKAFARLLPKT